MLAVTFAEVSVILIAVLVGLPAPLLALQILWINVVAEDFPAIGLAVEPARAGLMNERPRNPREPILSRSFSHTPSAHLLLYSQERSPFSL